MHFPVFHSIFQSATHWCVASQYCSENFSWECRNEVDSVRFWGVRKLRLRVWRGMIVGGVTLLLMKTPDFIGSKLALLVPSKPNPKPHLRFHSPLYCTALGRAVVHTVLRISFLSRFHSTRRWTPFDHCCGGSLIASVPPPTQLNFTDWRSSARGKIE